MTELAFYFTSHCHLCEQAEALLINIKKLYDIDWKQIEISTDDNLIDKYGVLIPVIKRLDNDEEISWPFCETDIVNLIKPEHTK